MLKGKEDMLRGKRLWIDKRARTIQGLAMTLVILLQVKALMKQCIRILRAQYYCNKAIDEGDTFYAIADCG